MMIEFRQKEMRDINARLKIDIERLTLELKDLKSEYAHEKQQIEIAQID
jgi:hypothetical protein